MDYKFGLTVKHRCPYLDDQEQQNIILTEPEELDDHVVSQLNVNGFRRSGAIMYRPHCGDCTACESSRIVLSEYKMNRSQKRCVKANPDVSIRVIDSISSDPYFELYERYIAERHADGDMYPASRETYDEFLKPSEFTHYLELTLCDQVIGVMVYDVLYDGLSAVYSFFEPELSSRGLGKLLILALINLATSVRKPYVYLGYAVDECTKMQYKLDFKPQERFKNNQWIPI